MQELSELEDVCIDVWKENRFYKYQKKQIHIRLYPLEDITFVQFVSKYTKNSKGKFVKGMS